MKTVGKILCGFGRGLRIGLVAIGALAFTGSVIAVADYTATQGTGITFASIVISTKHYFANVICDATIGETQCQAVNSSGQASVLEANSSSILSAVQAAIPAGTNLIGKTGIDQTTDGTTNGVRLTTQYPAGATPVTASATGTTTTITASLPAVASNYNFVCGYSIRANAASATTVADTLSGVISGPMSSELWVAPAASGLGVDEQIFTPCIPGSAVNTAISAISGAPGTSGLVSSKIWGYYKTTTP